MVKWSLTGLVSFAFIACDDSTGSGDRIVEGVSFTELFAEPSQSEIDQVLAAWADRDVSARNIEEIIDSVLTIGALELEVRIIAHDVTGTRHIGAIATPIGASPGSLPVLVVGHGGDAGISLDGLIPALPLLLGGNQDQFVFVVPSFRSEPLVFGGIEYRSSGQSSPWDFDVDDALALVSVALETTPEADGDRVAVLGFSRGAGVGLLMAARDAGIDVVVEFFGPTDFFGPFVQDVVEEALRGSPRDLPGLEFLDERYIQPLKAGELTVEEARLELLRRSAVYFAERLPELQIHHGTEDEIVPVGEAERLIEVMEGLGRGAPDFEFFIYEGGAHDPFSLNGSIERTRSFLIRLVSQTVAAL